MVTLLLTAQLALATTPVEISACINDFNQHAVLPIPTLSSGQTEELMKGNVVRTIFQAEKPEDPSAVVAFVLSPRSRNSLWIAAQDPHTKVDPGLTERVVKNIGPDHAIWYGHWDLPRPVRDRQWVVESTNSHALSKAMDGKGWEHSWLLVENGLEQAKPMIAAGEVGNITLDDFASAIFTPVNKGAWFMFELDDGQTLLGYQATSVVGGAVPTWLVEKLVMSRMESILRDLETRAQTWSPAHYSEGHEDVYGGDGKVIPRF
ncbi:MAG: hypothetical protein GWP91_03955 [Rhodobacterales bacterium]|nr:hypothetical protein [Rhodobacterales bacterium]